MVSNGIKPVLTFPSLFFFLFHKQENKDMIFNMSVEHERNWVGETVFFLSVVVNLGLPLVRSCCIS